MLRLKKITSMALIYLTADVMAFHANVLSFYLFRVLVCENDEVNTEPKKKKKAKHSSLLLHCYVPAVFFLR